MSNAFFRNPRLVVLTLLVILVAGLSALELLPRREDPKLTGRFGSVTTRFPGATAERVEALVTEKLEQELEQLSEIKELQSSSRRGFSSIQVKLRDEITDADPVWSKLRDKIAAASLLFPAGVLAPELDDEVVDASTLILGLSWNSDAPVRRGILRRFAESLSDRVRRVSGTKKTLLYGAAEEEILVRVDELQARALGLSAAAISQAIEGTDAKVAAGRMRSSRSEFLIGVEGELSSLAALRDIPLRSSDGRILRLGEIARVERSERAPMREKAYLGGGEGVAVSVTMMEGRRIDRWAADVQAQVEEFRRQLPSTVRLEVLFDQSRYVQVRLAELMGNFLLGALLVGLVIWFMMGWRSALLVGSALPLASLMVLGAMRLMEIPLHQMSVTGLIIALGLLIDNAIVIVDEVRTRLRTGLAAAEAISRSVQHLFVPLLGSTLTTVFAFMPIVLMPGAVGEFVGSIGLSVILALLSSFFLAMTVVPALTGYLLGRRELRPGQEARGRPQWWREGFRSQGLSRAYRASLGFFFARPLLGILLALLLPLAGFWAGTQLQEQFFPPAERDQFVLQITLPPSASLAQTSERALEIREQLRKHEQVAAVHWFVGRGAPRFYYNLLGGRENSPMFAQALVQLRSSEGALALINELQLELDAGYPDTQIICKQLEQGPPFDAPVEIRIYGPDLKQLRLYGEETRAVLASIPGVTHTRASLADAQPKLEVELLPDEAELAGLSRVQIARQMQLGLEGRLGGSMLEASEELRVRVRLEDHNREDTQGIASLELLGAAGRPMPLTALGSLTLLPETAAIPHFQTQRCNTVQGFLLAGELPSAYLSEFNQRWQERGLELRPGYHIGFGGESKTRNEAVAKLMASVGLLVTLIAATLVLSFKSFRLAGVISMVALLAIGLAMLSLWLFGYPFGFTGIVGAMGLVGVAINDSIVVLAGLRENASACSGNPNVVVDIVSRSTRHIIATTVTTVAGFLPLILSGGGFWPPIAITIAGGVLGSTILALYFVPSAFLLLGAGRQSSKLEPPRHFPTLP
ncbi:MAG: acriflavine resistance protein B [Planctomycetota bacterium]|nr:MAG: acriflavine resistance protein B [Planctomycetota bacterium]